MPQHWIQPFRASQSWLQTPVVPQEPVALEALSVPAVATTNQGDEKPVYFSLSDRLDSSEESQGGDDEQAIQGVGVPNAAERENAIEPEQMAEFTEPAESVEPNTDAEAGAEDARQPASASSTQSYLVIPLKRGVWNPWIP